MRAKRSFLSARRRLFLNVAQNPSPATVSVTAEVITNATMGSVYSFNVTRILGKTAGQLVHSSTHAVGQVLRKRHTVGQGAVRCGVAGVPLTCGGTVPAARLGIQWAQPVT